MEAVEAALGFCKDAGGVACKTLVAYEQCGALAVSGTGDAGCQNDACKVVASDCNGAAQ